MERHALEVDGELLAWYDHGEGTPIVFLHGIPTGPSLWRHAVPLVEGGRSLVFEMLGYADSINQGAGRDISVAAQASRLIRWLDALGIDRSVLVGHDLGGGVAQIAAVHHPDRCAGLVLTNSICYDSWPIPSVKAMRAAAPLVERMPNGLFRRVLSSFLRVGHDDDAVAVESARLHWQPYARQGGAAAFVAQIRSLHTADTAAIADRLPDLDVPARVVWGAADRFQKIAFGERLARDLHADIARLDGAKHFVPEDHPDRVALAVNEVVAAVRGSRR